MWIDIGYLMSVNRNVRHSRLFPFLFVFLLIAWAPALQAGIGFRTSLIDSSTSNQYLRRAPRGLSAFQDRALGKPAEGRKFKINIDSTYTLVYHTLRYDSTHLQPPMIQDFDDYVRDRLAFEFAQELVSKRLKSYKPQSKTAAGEGIAIDLPYRIKSKTFRRLFGGDNVGVRVQGNIQISGSLRRQKFDAIQTANQRNTNTAFNIDMVQQFTITGKVGQKVEVKVDQDSERLFDFENSLKLTYTGDEDEIIQKIEAGNVNLSLGTKLATFSGKNTGLFGLKTQMKMGPLSLTGIASMERGQKNRQSPNLSSKRASFNEKSFVQNRYFWLTNTDFYTDENGIPTTVANYRQNYRRFINRQHVAVTEPYQIKEIAIFVTLAANEQVASGLDGRAVALQYYDDLWADSFATDQDHVRDIWRRLDEGSYTIDTQLGYIRLNQPVTEGQALACAFITRGGDGVPSDTIGTLTQLMVPADNLWRLVLLKPRSSQPTDSTWTLMFRHIYDLQAQNLDKNNFKLDIVRSAAAGQREETGPPTASMTYLQFFQFDLNGTEGSAGADGFVDDIPSIIDWEKGELEFLDLQPFDPIGYWDQWNGDPNSEPTKVWSFDGMVTEADSNFAAPYLYTVKNFNNYGNIWRFSTEYRGSSSVFDLGPLVLEGSEEVTLNGQPLQRGTDYTIDYLSGQLRILNEAAKVSGADLQITYESGRVFQLDKTTLLGARAEYGLWQDSYIGGMVLYLNQKTLDRRVRIGNEPIRNTLWDANTSLKFKPNFLTRIVDAMPLITTNAASDLTIDAEIAKVFPNPNSLENRATGDVNGLAFVDDFESSRRSTPLGMMRRNWTIASIPEDPEIDYRRGRLIWHNPRTNDQVKVKDVFPEREVNSQVANTLQSIIMKFTPDTAAVDLRESWGGVMRYLGEAYADQSRSQFLEFWIKLPPQYGKLKVDLGTISEDALPDGILNTEDRPLENQQFGNGVLSREEDVGLDGIDADDPGDMAMWNGLENDKYGNPLEMVPSWDDWQYSSGSDNFERINGTEGSLEDEGGRYPDTEDLNGNRNLDITNNYYSYTIELDRNSPYITGGNPNNNWRMFRIPISGDTTIRRTVGNPDLTNVRWARIYLTGFSEPVQLEMVQMDIVSNEWLPVFSQLDSTEYITPAVANTHENPGYEPPPGVQGEIDPITELRQREQSLVLKIHELDKEEATNTPSVFFVAKNLYSEYNLLEYKHLKMFVHGGGIRGESNPFPEEKYELILRLGQNYSDIHNNYYEIITPVKEGWDESNHIDVLMNDLALLHPRRGEAGLPVSERFVMALDSSVTPDSIAIEGSPTMARIGFIAVGVRLNTKHYSDARDDEIWVDELRVSDIYKDPGTAAEVNTTVNLADFITLAGGYRTMDADFHNVNTRINPNGSSSNSWRLNTSLNLHKLYVERWGFRLPFSLNFSETNTIPRTIPSTDTRITPDQAPDSIKANAQSVTSHLSYSKTGNSPNPLVRWTLEKLSASWSYTQEKRKDYNIEKGETQQNDVQATYTFPTDKGRGVQPIWWMRGVPLLKVIGSPTFYYKPTKLTFAAAANRRSSYQANRPTYRIISSDSIVVNQVVTRSISFPTSRSFSTGFAPFRPLTLDVTRSYKALLDSSKTWADLLKYDFGRTNEIQQNFTSNYAPEFYRWFKPTFTYNAGYTWSSNLTQNNQKNVSNQRTFGTDVQLDFRQIFGQGGSAPRDRRRPDPAKEEPTEEEAGGEEEAKADSAAAPVETEAAPKSSPFSNIKHVLTPFKTVLFLFDPVAISFDHTTRHSQQNVLGQAGLAYQFGLTDDPKLKSDSLFSLVPSLSRNQDISVRTGMRLFKSVRATYVYNHRTTETIAAQTLGTIDRSVFWFGSGNDPKHYPFADVTLDWSGLEKFSFLSPVARTVSLNSSVSQKISERWTIEKSNVTSRTFTRNWSPLLGVNFAWKGDIDSQVRYSKSTTMNRGISGGNSDVTSDNGINATLSYSLRTGFRLPLPFMHDLRLQNQTTFSLNVDYRTQKRENQSSPTTPYSTTAQTSTWSIGPSITYSFSSTVQGQAKLLVQENKDEIQDTKNRLLEFGINVNIAIRG